MMAAQLMPAHLLFPSLPPVAAAEAVYPPLPAATLAPLTVTGIGSLPHPSLAAALAALSPVAGRLAHVPQLPTLGPQHGMLAEAVTGLPGAGALPDGSVALPRLSAGYPCDGTLPTSVAALLASAAPRTPLKGQLAGPLTLALHSRLPDGRPCAADPAALDALALHMGKAAAAYATALAQTGAAPVLFLDEPELPRAVALLGAATAARLLTVALNALPGVVRGVHCCARPPLNLLAQMPLEVVSVDAHRYGPAIVARAPAVAHLLARGGSIAWGIVPTDEAALRAATPDLLAQRLRSLWSVLTAAGVPADVLVRQSLLTPACGLAGLSIDGAARAMALCADLAAILQPGAAA